MPRTKPQLSCFTVQITKVLAAPSVGALRTRQLDLTRHGGCSWKGVGGISVIGGTSFAVAGDVGAPGRRLSAVRRRVGLATAALVILPGALVGLLAGSAGASTAGTVSNYTGTGIDEPYGIVAGPNGSLWFANFGNSSIGEISTTGAVSNFTDPTIDEPVDITAGPNGALWFTNYGDSTIGEITTAGLVSNFTDASISHPTGITTGPDGALWFANQGNNSIGRITTSGSVSNFTNAGIVSPYDITPGPQWRTLVHQPEPERESVRWARSRPEGA